MQAAAHLVRMMRCTQAAAAAAGFCAMHVPVGTWRPAPAGAQATCSATATRCAVSYLRVLVTLSLPGGQLSLRRFLAHRTTGLGFYAGA